MPRRHLGGLKLVCAHLALLRACNLQVAVNSVNSVMGWGIMCQLLGRWGLMGRRQGGCQVYVGQCLLVFRRLLVLVRPPRSIWGLLLHQR